VYALAAKFVLFAATNIGSFSLFVYFLKGGISGLLAGLQIFDDFVAGGGGQEGGDGNQDGVNDYGGESEGCDQEDDQGDAAVGDGEGDVTDKLATFVDIH
jgi:hypothetical protein